MNSSALFDMIAKDMSHDKHSIRYMDQISYTYGSMFEKIEEYASLLNANGVRRHSSIAFYIPNSPTLLFLLMAAWKLDLEVVLLDSKLKQSEAEQYLMTYTPEFLLEAPPIFNPFSNFVSEVNFIVRRLRENNNLQSEYALLLFTSGSTGMPKVVGRTADSIRDELLSFLEFPGVVQAQDVVLVLSSISHSFGLITGVLTTLFIGASVVFCSSRAPQILRTISQYHVSVIYGVPFHFDTMSSIEGSPMELPSLRSAVCAGEPLNRETHGAFEEKYGISIGCLYGTSETGTLTADLTGIERGTVGKVIMGKEIRIIDDEIYVRLPRSPYIGMQGAERYQDGWLRTHDLGEFGEHGALYHKGRSDSLVIIGGRKVYLQEIENVIRRYDGIQEIVVSYETHRVISAYFTVREPFCMEAFADWCRKELSNFKVPRVCVIVDSFRRSPTGKLLRKQLDQLPVRSEYRI